MSEQKGSSIFSTEGTPVEIRGNRPLFLNDPDKIWFIQAGSVDIFYVPVEGGEPVGPRRHLFRALRGEALFGFDFDPLGKGVGVLAVGPPGSLLLQYDWHSHVSAWKKEADHEALFTLIHRWVEKISMGLARDRVAPRKYIKPEQGQPFEIDEGVYLRATERTVWLEHLEGYSLFMGREEWPSIQGEGLFPLGKGAWLQSADKGLVKAIEPGELLDANTFRTHFLSFQELILKVLFSLREQTEDQERKRLRKKLQEDDSTMRRALAGLGAILETKRTEYTSAEGGGNALLSAARTVGRAQGIKVVAPLRIESDEDWEPRLEDIARNSGFRTRQVALKGDWWRKDNGPLLAYREKNKAPVALLPSSPRSYELFDPTSGMKEKIGEKVALSLDPFAFTFYRPFPRRPLTGMDLIRFGIRGCRRDIWQVFLMGTLGGLLGLVTPFLTGIVFGSIIPSADHAQLLQITIILLAAAFGTTLFEITKGIALLRVEGKMDSSVQAALWDRLMSLPVPFFRNYTAGDLASRGMGFALIRELLSSVVLSTILSTLFASFNLALLFYYDWQLALVGLGLALLGILFTGCSSYLQVRHQRVVNKMEGRITGKVLQFITGIAKLRVTGSEGRAFADWAGDFAEKKKRDLRSRTINNVLATFNSAFPVAASMSIFMWFIWKGSGRMDTGDFLAFNAAYVIFQTAMLQMASVMANTLNVIPLYERAKPILRTEPESDETKARPGALSGDVEVNHLFFQYSADGPLILKDVSLALHPGEFIAIVGGSGSGKSTLFRLLLGFEKPEAGTIYYDGQDLETLEIRAVRQQLGVVLQNGKLMQGDIFKNIVGTANLTVEDAWEAARKVGLEQDIKAMPMGMNTMIPAGGGTLSGGQVQRLLIARALVKRPRILYFDEATSALDNRTQAIVSRSLVELKVSRAVIAHRLSTIIHADRIYVLHNGEILQTGTYEELMRDEKGFFAELARRQLA